MRRFVVLGHAAPTEPDFALEDLAGGAGRLDVLCRCVATAFLESHALREDVDVHLLLQNRLRIRLVGSKLRYLSPEERNVASLLRSALEAKGDAIGAMEAESTPGIFVSKRTFAEVLDELDGTLVQLHEAGEPIVELEPPEAPIFVLSDHEDFTDAESELLAERADARVRLGPRALHADQAITVAHNYLDTDGCSRY